MGLSRKGPLCPHWTFPRAGARVSRSSLVLCTPGPLRLLMRIALLPAGGRGGAGRVPCPALGQTEQLLPKSCLTARALSALAPALRAHRTRHPGGAPPSLRKAVSQSLVELLRRHLGGRGGGSERDGDRDSSRRERRRRLHRPVKTCVLTPRTGALQRRFQWRKR